MRKIRFVEENPVELLNRLKKSSRKKYLDLWRGQSGCSACGRESD